MNVQELKHNFILNLEGLYPIEEAQSFFMLLIKKHLNLSRLQIALNPEIFISEEVNDKFNDAIKRLKIFEPIQYIIGETEFFGLPFKVNSNVLIPRPETEELLAWILDSFSSMEKDIEPKRNNSKTILDIGTGSGCIAISLANNLKKATITGIDISESALRVAEHNASLNKVTVDFIKADVLNTEKEYWKRLFGDLKFDNIISNPPYIRELEKEQLAPNVLEHEPDIALFVKDEDPLLFYKRIAQLSKIYLKSDGAVYFEINQYLYKDLVEMLKTEGFKKIKLRKDIFGNNRMIKCSKDE